MSATEAPFQIFGKKSNFALEIRHLGSTGDVTEPEDWRGSWGEWRLWIAGLNLCELRLATQEGPVEVDNVRWFLAPLFIWIFEHWMPLLHEKRLPPGGVRETADRAGHEGHIWQFWRVLVTILLFFPHGNAGQRGILCARLLQEGSCPMFLSSAWTMNWSFHGVIGFSLVRAR